MQISCPHCMNGIELLPNVTLANLDCPSCGSHFSLIDSDPYQTVDSGDSQRTLSRFELLNEVGIGAFGSVWRGFDPQLDRTVAIKIPRKGQLNQSESDLFFKEARAAAQLKHPHIVSVHEIGRDEDTIFIVSDFVEGVSLADHLTAKKLSMRQSAKLCVIICDALQHAHEKGVIHRDLKPANVMLDEDLQPHVMDFGLAKRDAGEITMTMDGQILGTPAYMSPEQAKGSGHHADGRSDLYSVGVILFELLTGELPFRGNTRMLIQQVISEDAPSPLKLNSNIDRDLATITSKCLEKEPDKRYSACRELASDLQRYLDNEPILARPISSFERGWRWCKRKPALAGALAASLFLLLTVAVSSTIFGFTQATLKRQAELARQDAKASAKTTAEQLKIMTDAFESVDPSAGANADMSAREVLDKAFASLVKSELADLPKSDLLSTLAISFRGVGEFDLAVAAAEQCLELRSNKLGSNHPMAVVAKNSLVNFYESAGRFDEAIKMGEHSLDITSEVFGPDHHRTYELMNNLAMSYETGGRIQEAIELREKITKKRKEALGHEHPTTLTSIGNLANSLGSFGRHDEALQIREKLVKQQTTILGEIHPETLLTMNNLMVSLSSLERFEEAIELGKKVLALKQTKLGEIHPDTLRTMTGLADCYFGACQYEKAIELGEKTVALQESQLGPDHPHTLQSMQNLALCYGNVGRKMDAVELQEKTLKLKNDKLGENHPDTLMTMSNLAITYGELGQQAKSLELFSRVFSGMKSTLGEDHVDTKAARENLGMAVGYTQRLAGIHLAGGKFGKAEELLIAVKIHHGSNGDTTNLLSKLHIAQLAQRKWDVGLKTIDNWIGQLNEMKDADQEIVAWAQVSQSVCLLELGNLVDAESTAREALAIAEINDPNRCRAEGVIAVCLAHKDKFAEAEEKVINAHTKLNEMNDKIPRMLQWYISRATERIVRVYEISDNPELATEWRSKLHETNAEWP